MPGPGEINYYKIMIDATDGVGLITIPQLTSLHLFMLIRKVSIFARFSTTLMYFCIGRGGAMSEIGIVVGEEKIFEGSGG